MSNKEQNMEKVIQELKKHLDTMKFGAITLVVQDNHVIQIEVNEKIRLK